jgi:hypothetical protein
MVAKWLERLEKFAVRGSPDALWFWERAHSVVGHFSDFQVAEESSESRILHASKLTPLVNFFFFSNAWKQCDTVDTHTTNWYIYNTSHLQTLDLY